MQATKTANGEFVKNHQRNNFRISWYESLPCKTNWPKMQKCISFVIHLSSIIKGVFTPALFSFNESNSFLTFQMLWVKGPLKNWEAPAAILKLFSHFSCDVAAKFTVAQQEIMEETLKQVGSYMILSMVVNMTKQETALLLRTEWVGGILYMMYPRDWRLRLLTDFAVSWENKQQSSWCTMALQIKIPGSHPSAVKGRPTNFLIQDTAMAAETQKQITRLQDTMSPTFWMKMRWHACQEHRFLQAKTSLE